MAAFLQQLNKFSIHNTVEPSSAYVKTLQDAFPPCLWLNFSQAFIYYKFGKAHLQGPFKHLCGKIMFGFVLLFFGNKSGKISETL